MTPEHVRLCASAEWGELVERVLAPWVLEGRDLGDRVLEVGAGPGLVTDVLRRRAPWLVAVELDEPLAAALGRRLAGGNVEVVTADASALPFRSGQFSAVACCTTFPTCRCRTACSRSCAESCVRGACWSAPTAPTRPSGASCTSATCSCRSRPPSYPPAWLPPASSTRSWRLATTASASPPPRVARSNRKSLAMSHGSSRLDRMSVAILAKDLVRRFDEVEAVRGVSLEVEEGEIYGFLGPNGAGKSTIVRILTTLLEPTSGSGSVLGHDVVREPNTVRRLIGVALQEAGLDPKQTGRELLTLQARLYGLRGSVLGQQIQEVTELVDLVDALDRRIQGYSGGMKRRLDLASSLLHRPRVLFLDEPTTGLDPTSRTLIWDRVRELREQFGATIFLTTQYLEEADHLADRVAIINRGLIVREGTPEALKAEVGTDVIDVSVSDHESGAARVAILEMQSNGELPEGELRGTESGYTLFVPDGASKIAALVRGLDRAGISTGPISISRPSLDDVFLAATGGRLQASAESQPSQDGKRVPTGQGAGR